MFTGSAVADALVAAGVTHVVWLPDSALGQWDEKLSNQPGLSLIRVCREGEAIAIAAGLHLGGAFPIVMMQCTGLFEAGDSLRNFLHDLKLPLFLLVGVRSWKASQRGPVADTCPRFIEPIINAWQIPYVWLDPEQQDIGDLATVFQKARHSSQAMIALVAE